MTDKPEINPIERLGRIIRTEIRTKATPAQAYDAWPDPEKIAHWFPDRAEGRAKLGATITRIFDKFDYHIPYEVLIAQPARRFAIRWNPPPGMNPRILEVTISKESGDTVVPLVESGFREGAEWDEEFQGIESGWRMALALLKYYLDHYFGSSRTSFLVMRTAEFSFERVVPLYRTRAGLRGGSRKAATTVKSAKALLWTSSTPAKPAAACWPKQNGRRRAVGTKSTAPRSCRRFLRSSRIRTQAPRLLPHRPRIKRRALVAHHRRLPRPNRSPGLALRFLTGSIASGRLRQKMGATLARNLSKLTGLGNLLTSQGSGTPSDYGNRLNAETSNGGKKSCKRTGKLFSPHEYWL